MITTEQKIASSLLKRSMVFLEKQKISIVEDEAPVPGESEVLVKTKYSAISAGTELMIYRGQAPKDKVIDVNLPGMENKFNFPMQYGYSLVGEVEAIGKDVSAEWQGRHVFAFHQHESMFTCNPDNLIAIPSDIVMEDALFLANTETALTFIMDAQPIVGENVLVFGQGTVGLLTTAILSMFPLSNLIALDHFPLRRSASVKLGARACLDSSKNDSQERLTDMLNEVFSDSKADLVFEVSGDIKALMQAVHFVGFDGRVVIGSWYKDEAIEHKFDIDFHRSRIKLIGSQVSTIAPGLSGRWTKGRRLGVAWDIIRKVKPSKLITHRFPIEQADWAFRLIDERPEEAIQIIFIY